MASSSQPVQALASHLISQTLGSINLLESLNLLNSSDANLIRSKLPSPNGPFPSLNSQPQQQQHARSDPVSSFGNLSISPSNGNGPPSSPSSYSGGGYQQGSGQGGAAPSLPPRGRPLPQGPQENRAKALWDYRGTEADDLAFRAGDIVIIDEEVNEQWYRGRVIPQGQNFPLDRSGLFPSNYVEKLPPQQQQYYPTPPPPGPQAMIPYSGPPQGPPGPGYQPQYNDKPPYGQQGYQGQGQMVMMPPPPPQQFQNGMIVQQQIPDDQKKNKFGKLGNQLGNAAVTGAGFGFGSAVAGELVHAIF